MIVENSSELKVGKKYSENILNELFYPCITKPHRFEELVLAQHHDPVAE